MKNKIFFQSEKYCRVMLPYPLPHSTLFVFVKTCNHSWIGSPKQARLFHFIKLLNETTLLRVTASFNVSNGNEYLLLLLSDYTAELPWKG